jgi:hypothetical protein
VCLEIEKVVIKLGVGLVGNRDLTSCFLYYGENLLEFFEVFENGYTALGDGKNDPSFSYGTLFYQTLLHEEIQVFFKDAAVDVRLVHYVRQL